jgi:hypothetical protein
VLSAERWVIAVLRHRKFYALPELNEAIAELVEKLNQRPFRKREGLRESLFAELDRPALQPLPTERYVLAHWKTVRLNRLPRGSGSPLLQRSLSTGRSEAGSPFHRRHGRDLPYRQTGQEVTGGGSLRSANRTSPQVDQTSRKSDGIYRIGAQRRGETGAAANELGIAAISSSRQCLPTFGMIRGSPTKRSSAR